MGFAIRVCKAPPGWGGAYGRDDSGLEHVMERVCQEFMLSQGAYGKQ
jgi:hypothetical protein